MKRILLLSLALFSFLVSTSAFSQSRMTSENFGYVVEEDDDDEDDDIDEDTKADDRIYKKIHSTDVADGFRMSNPGTEAIRSEYGYIPRAALND